MNIINKKIDDLTPYENNPRRNDAAVELVANSIRDFGFKVPIVFDGFGGSGSTLIACEQLGRRCFTSELDPSFADVIIRRWESLTCKKAVKIN